ncbi:hypothetical protein HCN51_42545 [Nonomuraea sp. FMUSA5-5]|uniref:Uncharacterized protein n=1 Tax=Nonomuraea composti TaxID=2720023 RepID=A0ABX1BMN4_9ACTN|nr:hypothetical protein [Nonomuraea sp. FMUSA5-5]NJP96043.1 hypothetical protein [Nonomuraea sp. FMUSA5-5]
MKNIDDIEAIRPLARVEPGGLGGDPSGPAARALLAEVTAHEPASGSGPVTMRARRRYRVAWLAAAVALAAGIVAVPIVLRDGAPSSYAVNLDDGMVTIQIRDFDDAPELERRLRELGVPALVDHVPTGMMCREPRGEHVQTIPRGLYSVPENIPGEPGGGWQMRINTKLFNPGETFVWTISGQHGTTTTYLMRGPVAPCEPVPAPTPKVLVYHSATGKNGSLAGFPVEGKTVGEVMSEIRKRHLKAVLVVIEPNPSGGYAEPSDQDIPVGDDWIVWDAEERSKGVIRLLVTEERLDRNPVTGE